MRNITDELFNGGGIVYVIIFYTNDLGNLFFFFFTGFVYAKSVLMVITFIVLCVCVSVCARAKWCRREIKRGGLIAGRGMTPL